MQRCGAGKFFTMGFYLNKRRCGKLVIKYHILREAKYFIYEKSSDRSLTAAKLLSSSQLLQLFLPIAGNISITIPRVM